jgi:electron transport complex protein RnfC
MNAPLYNISGGFKPQLKTPEIVRSVIQVPATAPRLIIPLLEYWGDCSLPAVKVHDSVRRGQLIASNRHPLGVPRFASTSGIISDIADRPLGHPSGLSGPCIEIEADGEDQWVEHEPAPDYKSLNSRELLDNIYKGGVTGMGGGGFPVHSKLASACAGPVSLLAINAVECEPLISCDEALIRNSATEIIHGVNILSRILNPGRCVVALKEDMTEAAQLLSVAASQHGEVPIEIVELPDIYPIGSEKLLIYCLTGQRLNAKTVPAASGIVCQNVASVKAVYDTVVDGRPVTSRITTIAGDNILKPANLEVRLGSPVRELLSLCSEDRGARQQLVVGGPYNGYPLIHSQAPVDSHHNCILSLTAQLSSPVNSLPCINCGYCADVCPVQLLPQRLLQHAQGKQFQQLEKLNIDECIECGACDVVCPSLIPLTSVFRFGKGQLQLLSEKKMRADTARARFDRHQQRIQAAQAIQKQRQIQRPLKTDSDTQSAIIQAALERAKKKKSE